MSKLDRPATRGASTAVVATVTASSDTAPAPAAAPAPDYTKVPPTKLPLDEFHGLGGDYEIGPDGVRRPAAPAAAPAPGPEADPAAAAAPAAD